MGRKVKPNKVKYSLTKLTSFHKKETLKYSRFSKTNLVIFAAIFASIGGYLIYSSFAAGNTLYVSTVGSDSGSCTFSNPCATFNKAYQVAGCGDTVQVASGSYGAQRIDRQVAKDSCTERVVFSEAPGQQVVVSFQLGDANIGASGVEGADHIEARGFESSLYAWKTNDVVIKDFDGNSFYTNENSNLTIDGGDWGPCTVSQLNPPCGGNSKVDDPNNSNITIKNATFHDIRCDPSRNPTLFDCHLECMFINGGTNITISGNKFYNCEFYDIFIQTNNIVSGITIENNWFDTPWNGAIPTPVQNRAGAVAFSYRIGGGGWSNATVRFNSFHSSTGVSWNEDNTSASLSGNKAYGNIMGNLSCDTARWSYSYNLVNGTTCNGTDQNIGSSFPYISAAHLQSGGEYHLMAASSPINFVPTSVTGGCPLADFDGDSRPQSNACDAGADEYAESISNHYIRAGATGSGSGSDWTNACTDFTGNCAVNSLIRGDTYYVAAGTYASRNWSTVPAPNGTSMITIKGATATDHGTSTGWVSTYGVGTGGRQAHWSTTATSGQNWNWHLDNVKYMIFDGNTACGSATGPACADKATYGFIFDQPTSCTNDQENAYYQTGTVDHLTLAHIATDICGEGTSDVGRIAFSNDYGQAKLSNITFSRIYCEHAEVCMDVRANVGSGGDGTHASNIIIEYLYATNATSTPSHHGEIINPADEVDNIVLRYSVLNKCAGTACFAGNASGSGTHDASCVNSGAIYGNIFSNSIASGVIMGTTGAGLCGFSNLKIYNNTFYNNAGVLVGQNSGTSGSVFQNNLVYASNAGLDNVVHDYNTYISTTNTPSESHGQSGSSNPFVNSVSGDFHLTSDTAAWNSSGIPTGNEVDPDGVTRTSSRGTYQYVSSTPPTPDTIPPSSVTGLTMSSNTQTSISLTWTAATDNIGVAGYRMYKNNAVASPATTTSTSYTYTGLTCGTSYTLAVEPYDAAGNVHEKAEATTIRSTTSCVSTAADINTDGTVNITDLSLLLSSFGQTTTQCITNTAYKCDLSTPGDNTVNIFDLSTLLSKWGTAG